MNLTKPALGTVTKGYGPQPDGTFHHGIDYGHGNGLQVFAAATGVTDIFWGSFYGWTLRITHPDGTFTQYRHLSSFFAVDGVQVSEGQSVAIMGSTGTATDQVHLHFEYWVAGNRVNPAPSLSTTSTGTPITIYQEDEEMPQHVQVVAGGPAGFTPVGDYILTASGLEGATALALGFLSKNPAAYTYVCWGNEASAIDATVRAGFVRNLPTGTGGGLTPVQDAKLMAIPSADADVVDEAELGAALTSDVSLTLSGVQTKLDAAVTAINQHTDQKFDGLTLSTP